VSAPARALEPVGAGPLARARRGLRALAHWLRWRPRFAAFGWRSVLERPDLVTGASGIAIGRRVEIRRGARLESRRTGSAAGPNLYIGDGTQIHMYFHCGAAERVEIGRNVLIAGRVYVTDHDHDPGRPGDPPIRTGRVLSAATAIEDDCWLGEGCMVLKGVRVGRGSIVGAGAVVNRDVPPYHIVVGAPARAVKRWDAGTQTWVPIEGA
jgi:acetyltransferase-like isoleucine patch superfamily enzyme